MESSARRYGEAYSLPMLGMGNLVLISDPTLIQEVFTGDPEALHAGEVAMILEPIVGPNSLLCLDGRRHLRERKLLLPPFHGAAIRAYESEIAEVAKSAVARWPIGQEIRLQPLMADITLEVILRVVYGIHDASRQERLRTPLRRLLDKGSTQVAFQVPALRRDLGRWSPWGRFNRMVGEVNDLIYDEIARRRIAADLSQRNDVLSLLLKARHEDGSSLTDHELRDELVTMLTAGHETTATALSWAFELLFESPDVYARLVDAVDRGDRAYVDAVSQESLRLRPVIPMAARKLKRPLRLGGLSLPAGTVVAPSIHNTHRRADIYPEPERFLPERFLDRKPGTYTWIPFGGGVRRCIGAALAQTEMRVVLTEVLRQVTLRPVGRGPQRIRRRSITLAPARGTPAIARQRETTRRA